jgi:hypothetical protein
MTGKDYSLEGILKYSNGDVYEGAWYKGMYGKGTLTYKNGDKYDGMFSESMRHGLGQL